jgi:hypothetical protein
METYPNLLVPPDRLQIGKSLVDTTASNNQLMKLARKKKGTMPNQADARVDREPIYDPYEKVNTEAVESGEFYRGPELPKQKKGGASGKPRKVSEWNLFVKSTSKWPGLSGFGPDKIKVMSHLYKIAKTEGGTTEIEKYRDASIEEIVEFLKSH